MSLLHSHILGVNFRRKPINLPICFQIVAGSPHRHTKNKQTQLPAASVPLRIQTRAKVCSVFLKAQLQTTKRLCIAVHLCLRCKGLSANFLPFHLLVDHCLQVLLSQQSRVLGSSRPSNKVQSPAMDVMMQKDSPLQEHGGAPSDKGEEDLCCAVIKTFSSSLDKMS